MRILIVDDSRAMRMILRRVLRHAGYGHATVEEAANGNEAMEAIASGPPDLVLTDWNMPEMSGLELLEKVQELGVPVRIGMVTSQGTPATITQAKEAGAAFLLTKPVTADRLSVVLGEVLV